LRVVDYSLAYTSNSGLLNKETFTWLVDSLLKSPAAYVVIDGELHAIIITGQDGQDRSDNDIPSLSITWQFTEPDNTVSQ
jgi:hypothetical protein